MADEYRKSTVREYFESICIAVILALFVRTFVVQAFKIPTGSMENNLLIGDHLLVNKFLFASTFSPIEEKLLPIEPISRGDIVVFKFPDDPERDFVKRVIGLPGDTVEMRNKKVYINGAPLDEPYVHFMFPPGGDQPNTGFSVLEKQINYGPVVVPADRYFMMGDNRDNSEDSRFWNNSFMPRSYVKGKALFVYFSFGNGGVRWSRLLHQIH
jgi:signal peptidase I